MKLTDIKIRSLSEPGRYFDGDGLYLEIGTTGGRYWRYKYRFGGKEKRLAFGVYPEVGLRAARDQLADARSILRRGEDPGALRKSAKLQRIHEAGNTLEVVARDWLAHMAARWAPVTMERIKASLEADVFPALGSMPMATIKPRDLRAVVLKVEKRGAADQAGRIMQRVKAIYRYAVTHERIDSNPMVDLMPAEVLKPRQVNHRPALKERELPEFLRRFAEYEGDIHTVQALRLLMLTAVRPGEVRGARWDEMDLEKKVWRIPAERMKMRNEHVVPLSTGALEALGVMKPLSGHGNLVFPSPYYPTQALSENTLNSAMTRMGYKGVATAHGFRALFSTVANEAGWNPDVIERQLAHAERNEVRAAYHRSTYLQERIKLMQWWSDYLQKCGQASNSP